MRTSDQLAIALPANKHRGFAPFLLVLATVSLVASIFFLGLEIWEYGHGRITDQTGLVIFSLWLLISIPVLLFSLYWIWGDLVVGIDRKSVLIQRRLWGRKWTKVFETADIVDICITRAVELNEQPVPQVGIHFNSHMPFVFGSDLSDAEREWLVGEIYAYWKELS